MTPPAKSPRFKPGAWWPVAVVGFLAVNVAANVVLIWAARDRGGNAIEPDYYRKAVAWDSTLAAATASRALGWTAAVALGPRARDGRELEVRLAGPGGAPLEGARVTIEAIHNLEAATPVRGPLAERAPGIYSAVLPLARGGLWEVRVAAERGGARFTTSLRTEAAP